MVCRTKVSAAAPWRVGVEDPRDPSRVLAVVPVRNGGVATSGSTHRGHHIVDARSGTPSTGVASVTVVAPDLVAADLDATAAFAMGHDALRWLRTRAGRCGVVVWTDGTAELFTGG
jgi:thiamine biosynthesis lipoprotein